jgi:hypothetical protein
MTKTADLILSLQPNQGWWITTYLGQVCEGTRNDLPFASKADARVFAEREAKRYQRQGYETHISESRKTIPAR